MRTKRNLEQEACDEQQDLLERRRDFEPVRELAGDARGEPLREVPLQPRQDAPLNRRNRTTPPCASGTSGTPRALGRRWRTKLRSGYPLHHPGSDYSVYERSCLRL